MKKMIFVILISLLMGLIACSNNQIASTASATSTTVPMQTPFPADPFKQIAEEIADNHDVEILFPSDVEFPEIDEIVKNSNEGDTKVYITEFSLSGLEVKHFEGFSSRYNVVPENLFPEWLNELYNETGAFVITQVFEYDILVFESVRPGKQFDNTEQFTDFANHIGYEFENSVFLIEPNPVFYYDVITNEDTNCVGDIVETGKVFGFQNAPVIVEQDGISYHRNELKRFWHYPVSLWYVESDGQWYQMDICKVDGDIRYTVQISED